MTSREISGPEAERLRQQLAAAVPHPPLVPDRASRAIRMARRRQYGTGAAVAGTLVAMAGVVALPVVLTSPSGDVVTVTPASEGKTAGTGHSPREPKVGDVVINTSEWTPGKLAMEAIVGGELSIDSKGCVHLTNGDFESDVVWPKGFTARLDDAGRVELLNPRGDVVLREGQNFATAGGTVDYPTLSCRSSKGQVEVVNGVVRPENE